VKVMKILVALDGSREAEAALPKAVALVKQNDGAKVVLVRAVDPATLAGTGAANARVTAINEAAEYLGDVAAQLRKQGVRPVVRSVWYAAAGVTIAGVARAVKPDLIVMATRRRDDTGRLVAGPIARCVLDRTRTPILLVAARGMLATIPGRRAVPQEPETVHA
jgi:nucleotide-binding universal stress UspA family protein